MRLSWRNLRSDCMEELVSVPIYIHERSAEFKYAVASSPNSKVSSVHCSACIPG